MRVSLNTTRVITSYSGLTSLLVHYRNLGQTAIEYKELLDKRMQTWQIHSYGGTNDLRLSYVNLPTLTKPNDILIKVEACSVNPIDVAMSKGYGSKVLNVMRKATGILTGASITSSEIEFPLTMGRDFTGIVLSKGHGVGNRLEQGDQVWGVIPVHQQGCHSECVVVDSDLINRRPENVSYLEGASILYAGLTAWSALWLTGGLCYKINLAAYRNKRVLLLGGSGGVGTQAIQLLKAWNMHVVTTCSSDAITLLEKMGADIIIDYKCDGADQLIKSEGPYDIILDCANQGPDLIKVKGYPHSTYITLNSPMLKNIDKYGLFGGGIKNIVDILKYNIYEPQKIGSVKWGFFVPSRTGLNMLQTLVESGKVKPVVMEVYAFKDLPKAYERIARGHLRGKLVIDLKQGS